MKKKINIQKRKKELLKNIPKQFQKPIEDAIKYANNTHGDEERFDGQLMIEHLLNIALLTTEVGLDINSTIASLLHQIPLYEKQMEEIEKTFGSNVVDILQRMTEIKNATNTDETDPEIITKYILNSSDDLRPVIIKVLDTLCDMKDIENIPEDIQKSSLKKALYIYAILAEYLNLYKIKKEIEENAFKEYKPIEYESITKKMLKSNIDDKSLGKYKQLLINGLKNLDIEKEIEGRIKCKYSIYNKLKKYEKEWKNPNIARLRDIIGFRILTDTKENCFRILEKIMDLGEAEYTDYEDYISNPKPNGYKAIQFPVKFKTISDLNIELQILTHDMYYHNTYGPASHIAYKASQSRFAKPTNEYGWVEKIHKGIQKSKKEREKKINIPIKCKIYEDEVFAFTPKGKILNLNKGDTALDFAFKLHTEIGNSAVGAIINGKASKLSTPLKTGDIVEIKRDKSKKCQKIEALKMVNSDTNKFRIRNQLSKYKRKG